MRLRANRLGKVRLGIGCLLPLFVMTRLPTKVTKGKKYNLINNQCVKKIITLCESETEIEIQPRYFYNFSKLMMLPTAVTRADSASKQTGSFHYFFRCKHPPGSISFPIARNKMNWILRYWILALTACAPTAPSTSLFFFSINMMMAFVDANLTCSTVLTMSGMIFYARERDKWRCFFVVVFFSRHGCSL